MADIADLGSITADRHLAESLAKRAESNYCDSARESYEECIDCGEPIPEARRRAVPGCMRCVQCQQALEEAACRC